MQPSVVWQGLHCFRQGGGCRGRPEHRPSQAAQGGARPDNSALAQREVTGKTELRGERHRVYLHLRGARYVTRLKPPRVSPPSYPLRVESACEFKLGTKRKVHMNCVYEACPLLSLWLIGRSHYLLACSLCLELPRGQQRLHANDRVSVTHSIEREERCRGQPTSR